METIRKEILPGVWLTALENDKFKTGCLSISLLTQLDRETAAQNALIPYVLRRGSRYHTDMQALAAELDGLYGSYIDSSGITGCYKSVYCKGSSSFFGVV